MRKLLSGLVATGTALLLSAPATATVVDYSFGFAGFSGTASIEDSTDTLTAFAFDLDGKLFGLSDVTHDGNHIGGNLGGFYVINSNLGGSTADNDFFMTFVPGGTVVYTTPSTGITFSTLSLQVIQAAVPEPATWAMMIGGLGMVGASLRRRTVRFA